MSIPKKRKVSVLPDNDGATRGELVALRAHVGPPRFTSAQPPGLFRLVPVAAVPAARGETDYRYR
jgi:hypothetical protein